MSILSQKIAKNKSPEKVNRHRTHIFHGQADIDDPSTYRRLNSWGSTLRSRYISLAVRFGRTKHTNCDAPLLNRHEGTNEAGLRGSLCVSGGRCVWWAGVQSDRGHQANRVGKKNIDKRGKKEWTSDHSPRQWWQCVVMVGRGSVKAKSSWRDEQSGARHRGYKLTG